MRSSALRFLGLAFAGADLVFEIGPDGLITFALGAASRLTGRTESELLGLSWAELVSEDDRSLLDAVVRGLGPAERQGPFKIALRGAAGQKLQRYGVISVCRLPQLGKAISCALSLGGGGGRDRIARGADGLIESQNFAAAAEALIADARRDGVGVQLDLVEMAGLETALAGLGAEAPALRRRLAATFRAASLGGSGASEVARDRFAMLTTPGVSGDRLASRLEESLGLGIKPVMAQLSLDTDTPGQSARAIRYALDRYIEDGPAAAGAGFAARVNETVKESARFKAMVASGGFELAYQPVVRLSDETVHHFEALSRFDASASPAGAIRLAEDLGMICDLDLAVARTVLDVLGSHPPSCRIAVNFSALSLLQPAFLEAFQALTAAAPSLRKRLLIEVTETKRLEDLNLANQIIAALRRQGHLVCLDDFGAGAASLDYLSHLHVDFVKLDGRYIQDLDTRPRDSSVVKHVVALCDELGIDTIAEMIETPEAAETARSLGVSLGQGWRFSKPLAKPVWARPSSAPAGVLRRRGAVEQWG